MDVDDKVINRLFWWMKDQYGSHWVLLFGSADQIDVGKELWKSKLKRFNRHDIAKTLDNVKEIHSGKPPNIDQFVSLLKHLKGHRPGHLSNNLWQSRLGELQANKAKLDAGQECLKRIREENGI